MRKLTLYIAMSLDGYIAKPNDDLSFLSMVQTEGEDYGYAAFSKTIDTVIMGRKTFDWVTKEISGLPHPGLDTYVITRAKRPDIGKTRFYTGSLKKLVVKLKSESGKTIFCDGGAEIVNELLKDNLIDEFIISVIPVLLGQGTMLFKDGRPEQKLSLVAAKSFKSGLAQLHYKLATPQEK
jgi:dihydrofolate reductase